MKKISLIVLLFLTSFLLISCQKEVDYSEIYGNDIYYTLFVRSFADSDGDGVGDLNGITENLDYFEDLGITGIWLLPIFQTASGFHNNHGYATVDYLEINPDYGTMSDLDNLLNEANKRDINILLDLVINHTSDQHEWFLEASKGSDNPYRDYYHFNSSGSAYSAFPGGMIDLNLNSPAVKNEIFKIVDFYLDKGVSGFRVDAVKHFYEGPKVGNDKVFMLELDTHVKNKNPQGFVVGEVFEYDYHFVSNYYISQASYFNFYVQNEIQVKVGEGSRTNILSSNLERMYNTLREKNHDFIDAPFLGNHDMDRIASSRGYMYSVERRKLAVNILLTLPGSPFIYYGDELDMKGMRYEGEVIGGNTVYDEYRRQPFIWNNEYQTTWLPSDGSNDNTKSYLEQKEDEDSMFNTYKEMIELRKNTKALMYGNAFSAYEMEERDIQAFVRYIDDEHLSEAVLVIHNISDNEYELDFDLNYIYGNKDLKPFSTAVLEIPFGELEAYI